MNAIQVEYFLAVAECLNFTKAAQVTFTSQPNISKQIALLEQELGFQLFTRTKQQVTLTPAGSILYAELKEISKLMTAAIERAYIASMDLEYKLRFGVSQFFDTTDLNQVIKSFQSKYPKSDVFIECVDFKTLRYNLTTGHYDIVITAGKTLTETDDLEIQVIDKKQMVLACSKSHQALQRKNVSLWDFKDDILFVLDPSETPKGNEFVLNICAQYGFIPHTRACNSLASYFSNIERGDGVAIFDRSISLPETSAELIELIGIPEEAGVAEVVAAFSKSNRNPAIKLFFSEFESWRNASRTEPRPA